MDGWIQERIVCVEWLANHDIYSFPKNLDVARWQVQTAEAVLGTTKEFLKTCPSDIYVIISQPGLTASDFFKQAAFVHVKTTVANGLNINAVLSVSEMVQAEGDVVEDLVGQIRDSCGGEIPVVESLKKGNEPIVDGQKRIVVRVLDSPPVDGTRAESLANTGMLHPMKCDSGLLLHANHKLTITDALLQASFLEELSTVSGPSYTFIYHTSPLTQILEEPEAEPAYYDAEFESSPSHIDLKRDFRIRDDNSSGEYDTRPLFEKYQYFTPGLLCSLHRYIHRYLHRHFLVLSKRC